MLRTLCLFLIFARLSISAAPEIELFIYWQHKAKGEELFSGEVSLLGKLRRDLEIRGGKIRSWDLDVHRKDLLNWGAVKNVKDFWQWLFPSRVDGVSKWVFWSLGPYLKTMDFSRVNKDRLVLFLWEPPTVEPEGYTPAFLEHFGKVFTWNDDLVDGVKFFKFHYPELRERIANIVPFEEKKLCTLMATRLGSKHPKQLYSEREKMIRFFEDKPELFDFYGRNWEKKKFRNWKGVAADKLAVIKNYKFSICYENMRDVKGYITEKIFDCFAVGNVPVYWGASNVTEYIPEDCFIDRRKFIDEDQLCRFLMSMKKEEYEGYLERAAQFLKSDRAKVFSVDHFIDTFLTID